MKEKIIVEERRFIFPKSFFEDGLDGVLLHAHHAKTIFGGFICALPPSLKTLEDKLIRTVEFINDCNDLCLCRVDIETGFKNSIGLKSVCLIPSIDEYETCSTPQLEIDNKLFSVAFASLILMGKNPKVSSCGMLGIKCCSTADSTKPHILRAIEKYSEEFGSDSLKKVILLNGKNRTKSNIKNDMSESTLEPMVLNKEINYSLGYDNDLGCEYLKLNGLKYKRHFGC
jgi:hypothetical protein